jgi:uncharacterized protein (TIGR02118 family)
MVKFIYCITRKPGMSVEEFQRHWREKHAPIARQLPNVRRYVQNHVLPEYYGRPSAEGPAYDGAAELWFDDLDAMRAAFRSPEAQSSRKDEELFIDHSKSFGIVVDENVVVGEPLP